MSAFRSISSWLGVFFLLLFLFSIWHFIFRSERESASRLLPSKVCTKNYPRQQEDFASWEIFYYKKGCAKIPGTSTLRTILRWIEVDSETIQDRLSLAPPPKGSAFLFLRNTQWDVRTSPFSAPALILPAEDSYLSRYYINVALIDLGIQEKYPNFKKSAPFSESLALGLQHNRFLAIKAPIKLPRRDLLTLLDRCQNTACEVPLRQK